jgi:hypothetical protein
LNKERGTLAVPRLHVKPKTYIKETTFLIAEGRLQMADL